MRTFKTKHILAVATGQPLAQSGSETEIKAIILFLCGIEQKEMNQISERHLDEIVRVNKEIYTESIYKQHPVLRSIVSKAKTNPAELTTWIEKQSKKLKSELSLGRAEGVTSVSPSRENGPGLHFSFNPGLNISIKS